MRPKVKKKKQNEKKQTNFITIHSGVWSLSVFANKQKIKNAVAFVRIGNVFNHTKLNWMNTATALSAAIDTTMRAIYDH